MQDIKLTERTATIRELFLIALASLHMDFEVPINLGDPFNLRIQCVYALIKLVLGLVYIYHLNLPTLLNWIVTLLFLMYWYKKYLAEDEW